MVKKVVKEFLKWLVVSIILGFFIWITIGLYRTIKDKVRGS